MKSRRILVVLIWILAVGMLAGDLALAQEQTDEPEPEEPKQESAEEKPPKSGFTESVKVTATRVETDLMKTPVAVTVFDQETLDRQGVKNVKDLAQMVPNMDIAVKNGQSTPMISLRGIRSTNETELGDPSVGVHLDGIYSPRMQGIFGLMFDNERVEVLRGPQGTLFGRNSTVGSINIVSAKPKLDQFESTVFVQYGNYDAPELQVMVNRPLTEDWAVRFAGRYHERDSYIDGYWDPNQYDPRYTDAIIGNPVEIAPGSFEQCDRSDNPRCRTRTQQYNWFVDETNDSIYDVVPADDDDFYMNAKEWAYRASALWQPQDKNMSLNLSLQHYRSESAGGIDLVNCEKLRGRPTYELDGNSELVLDDDGNPIVNGVNDCSTMFPKDDTYQAVVNVPGQFDLDIKYVRSQFTWDIRDNLRFIHSAGYEDQDRESAQDMEQSLNAWDQAIYFLPGTGSSSWVNELQLQSYGNSNFNWIVGANYFYEKTETIGYFDNPMGEKSFWDQPDRSTTASAVFAQGTYSYSPKWHLTIGGRYSDETKEDKGGRTYKCLPSNDCGSTPGSTQIINGEPRFARNYLRNLPENYFEDRENYDPDFDANDNEGSWNHDDWRVGLDYQKNDNTLLYGYLATGFKAGGIGDVFYGENIIRGISRNDPNNTPDILSDDEFPTFDNILFVGDVEVSTDFDEEEVTTLELGFKMRLLGGKLQLRGAYFFSDYDDLQYASPSTFIWQDTWDELTNVNGEPIYEDLDEDGEPDTDNPDAQVFGWVGFPIGGGYATRNIPKAEIQGFELEYDWRPWAAGRIHGYASWLDTEITDDWITQWDYDCRSLFVGTTYNECQNPEDPRLQVNLKGNDLAVSPPIKLHLTLDHAFLFERQQMTVVPWVTAHWEDDSYLTIWNVDKHLDDMDFTILPQDIKYTDDKREAWSMIHAGVSLYTGGWKAELYTYNLTDEIVQWWGGAAENVPKGSMSMPRTYGFRIGYNF